MSVDRRSGLRASAGGLLLAGAILLGGCGTASVEQAAPGTSATPLEASPHAGDAKCAGIRYEGVDAPYYRTYADWLRTSKIQKLDPESLQSFNASDTYPGGPPTFEYAADKADLVVSGKVADVVLVPEGLLTTFKVDRTVKGEKKASVYVMQYARVAPESPVSMESAPLLLVDQVTDVLFKNDRAVLFLSENALRDLHPAQGEFIGDSLGCAPIYSVIRLSGLYVIEDGKVKEHKTDPRVVEKRFDHKSEKELMDAAEARIKKQESE